MEQAPLFCCHDCKSSKPMDQFELRKRKNNPVFVASWTTPLPPDLPPPPWPPPHFHGHVSKHSAFCKVSIMGHLVRNVLKFSNRVTWLDCVLTTGPNPLCTYSARISHITCVCGSTPQSTRASSISRSVR